MEECLLPGYFLSQMQLAEHRKKLQHCWQIELTQ
jgi:hypothetical protein